MDTLAPLMDTLTPGMDTLTPVAGPLQSRPALQPERLNGEARVWTEWQMTSQRSDSSASPSSSGSS